MLNNKIISIEWVGPTLSPLATSVAMGGVSGVIFVAVTVSIHKTAKKAMKTMQECEHW